MYGQDRDRMRQMWCEAWRKARTDEPLEPLEHVIAEIVRDHPEYHDVVEDHEGKARSDWLPLSGETNPFLHMGMHLALQESVATDRPQGVREIYHALALQSGALHIAEHQMMECLAEVLWQAQRHGMPPDELSYLNCLRGLTQN